MIAPEPKFTALLEVIYRASLRARDLGYGGKTLPVEQRGPALLEVADLMDTIHNIPACLASYEDWDEEFFRDSFLAVYDKKWGANSGLRLTGIYDQALSGGGSIATTREYFRSKRTKGGSE
jgi:hypothetical protein